jgi:hypothetical protein
MTDPNKDTTNPPGSTDKKTNNPKTPIMKKNPSTLSKNPPPIISPKKGKEMKPANDTSPPSTKTIPASNPKPRSKTSHQNNNIPSTPRFNPSYDLSTYWKFENASCHSIEPLFDGTKKNFFSFLFQLKELSIFAIWRSIIKFQDVATGIKYNLFEDFTNVPSTAIIAAAKARWDNPRAILHMMDLTKSESRSRLLARTLMNSLTVRFKMQVQKRIDEDYMLDGPLYWIEICRAVFPSTTVFKAGIKTNLMDLRLANHDSLSEFIEAFLNHLSLVTGDVSDLVLFLFKEFLTSPNRNFKERVRLLKVRWIEGRMTCSRPTWDKNQAKVTRISITNCYVRNR